MSNVTLFFIIGVIATGAAVVFARNKDEPIVPWVFAAAALMIFGFVTFFAGPKVLGSGHVPYPAEEFTERLETGVAYQVISSTEDGKDRILLVKEVVASRFRVIRVEMSATPPEHFALVDGKPVAIDKPVAVAAPAEALSAKK